MRDEASSKFKKLIATLQQELELTGTEIAEILWLAQQSQTTVEETSNPAVKVDKPKKDDPKLTGENTTPDTQPTPVTPPQPTAKAEVFTKSSHSAFSSTSSNTLNIKVPDAPGLPQPLKLARALRPLMQKIDSETEVILDEEATANRIATEGIRIPVFQPAQEPAFDLVLVVDESNTMIFWQKTIQELQKLLKILGAFRDVQIWGLLTNKEGDIYLRRGTGKTSRKHHHYKPRSLVDPSGKRLFLLASDCVTDIWHNGKAFDMLKIWAQKNIVAILQMLPQWLWQRTGLSLGAKVQFSSLTPRIANQGLLIKKILLWDDIDFATGTKIPIFTLEEDTARNWSKMIAGKSDANVTGFVFPSNFITFTPPEEISPTSETAEIISNFRRTASPIARRLASLLSAAPVITLPIVRIIQAQMLKESQQVHVAEVFLGGILKQKQEIESIPETNPDEIEFDFINEDIRDNFLEAAPVTDSLEIIDAISEYFAKKINKTLKEFNALLRKPYQANNENQENNKNQENNENIEIKPFALLRAKVLKRLGGDYIQFAEEMEQEWDNSNTELRNFQSKLTSSEKTSSPNTDIQQEPLPSSFIDLSGQQRKQLQSALIDAFPDTASLEQMLAFELDKNLREIAGEGSLQEIVFQLIERADSEGWVEDLVRAACNSNPRNQQLRTIAQELLLNHAPETLKVSSQQLQQLQYALIDAFPTLASLEQMLAFELDKNLRAIAGKGSLQDIVFELIERADSEGWVEDLVRAACNSNPRNQQLRTIAQELLPNYRVATILILTAIPHRLRLDKEIRSIEDAIRRAAKRDLFRITLRTAVRPTDIRRAIAEEKPQIVHFCGHGLEDGSLLLEDEGGENNPVPASGLASLFQLHTDYVECVLLNACHSAKPAIAISEYINYAIGMNLPIGDKAAIAFAQGFYDGLGYATPNNQDAYQRAFDEGMVAIELENLSQGSIPVLKRRDLPSLQQILILVAIPHGLRLDKEIREIEEAIRRATNRDLFEIRIRTAVRPQDIRRAIAEQRPSIVHFCGHGLEDGSLLLEDDGGNNKPVSPSSLASLFKVHADYVKCVLLHACYSEKPAVAISQYINYVIGMNNSIQDSAAIEFAKGFYDGLGYRTFNNQDVFQRAFDEGMVAIQMENLSQGPIPVLKKR